MRDPVVAYVALGANLGDAAGAVRNAMDRIDELPGTAVTRRSSLYRTAPIDSSGPDYINAVIEVSTQLDPVALLSHLHVIEIGAGRERPYRNAPRTLDLDLLLHGSARIDTPRLRIPHPRMNERAFVLVPLAEIAPQLVPKALLDSVTSQVIERMTP
jgi:2-amino-4-hydroxy-6-hydroxymethyldihydropteridine diphosphokinase